MRNLAGKLATSGAALVAAFAAGDAGAQNTPYNWTGFYVGMHGDYGWGVSHDAQAGKLKTHGAGAGVQFGYNWQLSSLVIGAEIDGTLSTQHSKADPFFDGKSATLKTSERWNGTARLKVGLPVGGVPVFNNMLIYGTGGLAVSRWKNRLEEFSLGTFHDSDTQTQFGWVAGAGIEMPITSSFSAKLEYLRSGYAKKKFDLDTDNGSKISTDRDNNTARIGFNIHF